MSNQPPENPYGTPPGQPEHNPASGLPQFDQSQYSQPQDPSAYGSGYGAPAGARVERPAALTNAVRLMWVGLVLTLVGLIPLFTNMDELREEARRSVQDSGETASADVVDAAVSIGIAMAVGIVLVTCVLWALMAVFNNKGKKWARITATVIGGLSIVFTLVGLFGSGGLELILNVISLALSGAILFLLWRPENNPFYEQESRPQHLG